MEENLVRLTDEEVVFLKNEYPSLSYDTEKNIITGNLIFNVKYRELETIADTYQIEINLNKVRFGVPIVREIAGRILDIAARRNIPYSELHLNRLSGEMCIIIPPKAVERYPNGFDLKELLKHLEEHLYWVSYVEKYNKEPWKAYGHGDKGYLELFLEDKNKYLGAFKKEFKCNSRYEVRKKVKELKNKYKI